MFEARARRGATLVLVTHDRALADACDRRIVMRSGEIVEDVRAGVAP
jgi:putative ABC transport system ATP-binding protein